MKPYLEDVRITDRDYLETCKERLYNAVKHQTTRSRQDILLGWNVKCAQVSVFTERLRPLDPNFFVDAVEKVWIKLGISTKSPVLYHLPCH